MRKTVEDVNQETYTTYLTSFTVHYMLAQLSQYNDELDGQDLIPRRGKRFFSLLHNIQTSSGGHAASYPVNTRSSLSGG
jgi:hypothetical protein